MGAMLSKRGGKDAGKEERTTLKLEDLSLIRDLLTSMEVKGTLDRLQLMTLGEMLGFAELPAEILFDLFDKDRNGVVSRKEFIEGLAVLLYGSRSTILRFLFRYYDVNGDEKLDHDELVKIFETLEFLTGISARWKGKGTTSEELADLVLEEHDSDNDGVIDFEEFECFTSAHSDTLTWIENLSRSASVGVQQFRSKQEERLIQLELERFLDDEDDDIVGFLDAPEDTDKVSQTTTSISSSELLARKALHEANYIKDFRINYEALTFHDEIGSGASGTVYRGTWLKIPVAIKVVKEEMRLQLAEHEKSRGRLCAQSSHKFQDLLDKFDDELRLLGSLRHPNVMLYIGAVLETDRPLCIVTEYMSGGSLYKYLHDPDVPKLTLQERLQIGRQISHSLVYIHNRRPAIIHRDIKSENVLIDDATGRAVLCDFDMSITVTHKAAGQSIGDGTATTMAPEVINGEAHTTASDIYSLSIVLWELLTGESPYPNLPAATILCQVALDNLRPKFRPEHNVSEELENLLCQMWSEDPEERPSIVAVEEALSRSLREYSCREKKDRHEILEETTTMP